MSFDVGHTTFGFTMRVPDADVAAVDELISSHAAWMQKTHSLNRRRRKAHYTGILRIKSSRAKRHDGPVKRHNRECRLYCQ